MLVSSALSVQPKSFCETFAIFSLKLSAENKFFMITQKLRVAQSNKYFKSYPTKKLSYMDPVNS